jgi:pyrimidine nucleoside transport protein
MIISNPFKFWPLDAKKHNSTDFWDKEIFTNNKGLGLLALTVLVVTLRSWDLFFYKHASAKFNQIRSKLPEATTNNFVKTWLLKLILATMCLIYILFNMQSGQNLISLVGLFTLILLCVLMSKHPTRINWQIVTSGVLLQFIIGAVVLRVELGYKTVRFLTNLVTTFLDFTNTGSQLVFGASYSDHNFAFKILPCIVFFSAMVSLLFYLGLAQYVIIKLAWVVNKLMGTSMAESVNATANIFMGQTEAPLIIKPLLGKMTESEVFAVMVGGFATAAGSTLAAYAGFGVAVQHVIVASVMAAPGGLYVSKLIFPETEISTATCTELANVDSGYKKYSY